MLFHELILEVRSRTPGFYKTYRLGYFKSYFPEIIKKLL